MKVRALIERLQREDPDAEVMILDSFNGGGVPREINIGPMRHEITVGDRAETADCEELTVGTAVVVLGYGSY